MYSSVFCRIYNEFGWNVYPEVFAEQLWRWLGRKNAAVRTALDLGCGTGVLCRALAERGVKARGVDLSEGMIAIARERAPALRFDVGDMGRKRPPSLSAWNLCRAAAFPCSACGDQLRRKNGEDGSNHLLRRKRLLYRRGHESRTSCQSG